MMFRYGTAIRQCAATEASLGVAVAGREMETVCLERNRFHGDWNYVITPRHHIT
jgi:hypothetical protein